MGRVGTAVANLIRVFRENGRGEEEIEKCKRGEIECDWGKGGQWASPSLEIYVDTFGWHLQLSALHDDNVDLGLVAGALLNVFDGRDDRVAAKDFTEDDVAAIQMAG